jgi:NTE family protein
VIKPDAKLTEILKSYFGDEAGLDHSLLRELESEHLAGGEWLFKQGDPGDSFYFLIRGRLQVWIETGGSGEDCNSRMLGEIVPGDTVGEISLLTGECRTAGIRAIRDSMLVKVSRRAFERLAEQHPGLVMRLAGSVASVLHRRTSKAPDATRSLGTIAVIPLDDSPRASELAARLGDALEEYGKTRCISPDALGQHGAPVSQLETEAEVPVALINWLHDQEDESRFLVYRCSPTANPWSKYAIRQSDMIIFVGDALGDPKPAAWESELTPEQSGSMAKRVLVLLQPDSSHAISNTAAWLAPRPVDYHVHVRADKEDEVKRIARMISGNALGLVLSAGAARGIAQLGIFRALVEMGVTIDWVHHRQIQDRLCSNPSVQRLHPAADVSNQRQAQRADAEPVSRLPNRGFNDPIFLRIEPTGRRNTQCASIGPAGRDTSRELIDARCFSPCGH